MREKFNTDESREYYAGTRDIAKLIGCAQSTAVLFARKMNKELEDRGYMTIQGKVPWDYVYERLGLAKMAAKKAAAAR